MIQHCLQLCVDVRSFEESFQLGYGVEFCLFEALVLHLFDMFTDVVRHVATLYPVFPSPLHPTLPLDAPS